MLNKLKQLLGDNARAIAAQINPNDRGENYNTVMYRQHQQRAQGAPQPSAYAGGDKLVQTSGGVRALRDALNARTTTGLPVEWQDQSNGHSPTGYVSPEYQRAADAWAKRGKWGGYGTRKGGGL